MEDFADFHEKRKFIKYVDLPVLDQCVAWAFVIIQMRQNASDSISDRSTTEKKRLEESEYIEYVNDVKKKCTVNINLANGSLGEAVLKWIVKLSLRYRRPRQRGTKACCKRNLQLSANISRAHPLSLCITYEPSSFFQQRLLQEATKFSIPKGTNFPRKLCGLRCCKCGFDFCWRRDSGSAVDAVDSHDKISRDRTSCQLVLVFIASFLLLPIAAMCWWAAFVSVLETAAIIVFPIRKENKVLF